MNLEGCFKVYGYICGGIMGVIVGYDFGFVDVDIDNRFERFGEFYVEC